MFSSLVDIFTSQTCLIRRLLQHALDIINTLPHLSPGTTATGGLALWLCFVRALRWRRYNNIHRKYGDKWNNGLGTISPQEAQEIMHLSNVYDMPWLLYHALAFALFKTYGIPSISKLLAATKELKSKETASKRYADTVILIATWNQCPISGFADHTLALSNKGPNAKPAEDPRAGIALARTNWLHSKYKISNNDFLYTLCLFILEPIYWAKRHGWRPMSPLEQHAYYVFWVDIGTRMNIQDIPTSLEAMMKWSNEYENTYMVPAQTNHDVAGYTVDELLSAAPEAFGIKALGERIVICLLDEPTRKAMMYESQSAVLQAGVNGLLSITAFVQHFLLPPRISGKWNVEVGPPHQSTPGECPRLHPTRYASRPWYRAESTSALGYCRDKLLVKLGWYAEMPSLQLKSTGYRIEEMGPSKFEHAGHEEVMRDAAELLGCPITGPWSLEGRSQ